MKETEYELAKSEDRLHDAIAIRQEIQDLQKYVSDTTAAMVPKWKAASSSQPTLQQMQQLLVEKFGTAKVSLESTTPSIINNLIEINSFVGTHFHVTI